MIFLSACSSFEKKSETMKNDDQFSVGTTFVTQTSGIDTQGFPRYEIYQCLYCPPYESYLVTFAQECALYTDSVNRLEKGKRCTKEEIEQLRMRQYEMESRLIQISGEVRAFALARKGW